ncbi:NADH:flavin oxidoreductase [Blastopirellula retiformator]|uniref:NADPH dehydrogenase n=1 Tax=Blastopirellula retiformator TaxID=2527970 RepID=A0A5C5UYS4_9BACT|nr:NADH:flavin oxidoreductase [Blastopirellula retiformator]TWT30615.1 NADPH dehydrogenase [Blastopirellula retiformator]
MKYEKIAQLKSVETFRQRLQTLGISLPCDDQILTAEAGSPLAEPVKWGNLTAGNRWTIHPMEGWDANHDGSPTELTLRRWHNFGLSGAKMIWGGEAAAVQPDGRANPRQTMAIDSNIDGLAQLRGAALNAHHEAFGSTDDLIIGLQLTHSGRFCRPSPDNQLRPRIAYHHPLLDPKFHIEPGDDSVVWTDDEIEGLIDSYVNAARLAREVGYQFVDVKACHGYLLHEFLGARLRPGKFGGDFEGRTRVLKTIIQRVKSELPGIEVGVRLSAFDFVPYQQGDAVGQPMDFTGCLPYQCGFGSSPDNPLEIDLTEPIRLIRELGELGVIGVNISCGSPYYNPHIQRPAIFPPSDGYQPPEDPLVGVARMIDVARQCKEAAPDVTMVATGFTYLQDYLPHVAQAVVREGWVDSVGLGRMVLSFPDLPAATLLEGEMKRKKVCRTFSDCTTAPRNGMVSGCYPLDPFYKDRDEAKKMRELKKAQVPTGA